MHPVSIQWMFAISSHFSLDYPDTVAYLLIIPWPSSSPLTPMTSLLIQILFFSLRVTLLSLFQRGFYWSLFPFLPAWSFSVPPSTLSALCVLPPEHLFYGTCSAVRALVQDIFPCRSINIFLFISRNLPVSGWHTAHWSRQCLTCLSSRWPTSQPFLRVAHCPQQLCDAAWLPDPATPSSYCW